jgi:hypothetical protein
MISYLKRFDKWVDSHLWLLFFLLLILVLRIPNFFEPYWYGDEGIYLTLGNALRHGERLYAEIIDHKTPLIYYLAMVKDQLQFRVLLISWMLASTVAFYSLAKKLFDQQISLVISLAIFVTLTTLPWLEGHIPNGELFVMGFVLVAWWILTKTKMFYQALDLTVAKKTSSENLMLVAAGFFLGLGILTKVPAVMDAAAVFSLSWFWLSRKKFKNLIQIIKPFSLILLGMILPIIISMLYFIVRGSGRAYLDFGLLYNFRYAGEWSLPFNNPVLVFLFTLPGKLLIIGSLVIFMTGFAKKFNPVFQLIATWLLLAILGATLSNRPYPHYYLQVVPPLSLLLGLVVQQIKDFNWKKIHAHWEIIGSSVILAISLSVMLLLKVEFYGAFDYYQNFFKYATKKQTQMQYFNHFNPYMTDNYRAAQIIDEAKTDRIFIWGTNPMLYALSKTMPTGRFTVSFHIKDFNAYEETLAGVKKHQPVFIIVMKDEDDRFPEFFDYLSENYIPNQNFEHFTLWKRQAT